MELTTVEVGKRLGRSDSAVRRWIRLGMLDARPLAGTYLVRESTMRRFTVPRRGRPRSKP